jgi:hypothetical protein
VQVFSDANNYGDARLNVQDIVLVANAILNEQWPDAVQLFRANGGNGDDVTEGPMGSPAPGASIFDVKFIYTIAKNGIDVRMNNVVPVKGIQMKLNAADAPADLDVQLNAAIGKDFTVQKKIVDGQVRLLIYSLSGNIFEVGNQMLMQMPYNVTSPNTFGVIEPITVGGADNQSLKVEYEIMNVAGVDREVVDAFSLTNAPNPAERSTTISYTLANTASVSLTVTDTKGSVVARLVDGARQEHGQHSVEFNAANLPNGTYFYTLTADGTSVTKRLVVTR